MSDQLFKLEFEVRDYECDTEGIVNNAVYMNYLEHARHGYLKSKGFNFATLIEQGIRLVVIRIEADYLYPLHSSDAFYVTVKPERISKLRIAFLQDICRLPDDKLIMKARAVATSLNTEGRPKYFKELENLIT